MGKPMTDIELTDSECDSDKEDVTEKYERLCEWMDFMDYWDHFDDWDSSQKEADHD